jgi:hypothetical protein
MTYNRRLGKSDHFYIVFRIISYKNLTLKGQGIIKSSAVNYNHKEA